jgi:serpin B
MKKIFCFLFAGAIFCSAASAQTAGSKTAVDAINQFSVSLYKQLNQNEGNLFFSPYSISSALAMTYAGAQADTAKEMAKVLFFLSGQNGTHESFAALSDDLGSIQQKGDVELRIANSLWAEQSFTFKDDFLNLVKEHYKSEINKADFKNNSVLAAQAINAWVEQKTNSRIKDLVSPGVLNDLTRLVLVNAIYFKGKWQDEFKKDATQSQQFYTNATDSTPVELMYKKGDFKYAEDDLCQILEIPYKGNDLSMLIFLPQAKDGLSSLENVFSYEYLTLFQLQMPSREINVYLPKFKLEQSFSLNDNLKKMGMLLAFDNKSADFSGMADLIPGQPLYISDVIHKAFVEVNEEGTEAAAATAVDVATTTAYQTSSPKTVFRADHPFIFLIKDNKTGAILFLGRYVKPEPKSL